MRRGPKTLSGRRWVLALMAVVLTLLAFGLHLPSSPRFATMGPDSGMFAYGAQEVLSGRVLYRDVWDNKPPGVFYLDALALLLGGGSPWAIWWLGVVWVSLISIVLLLVLSQLTDRGSAFLGSILFLLTLLYPGYYSGGNLTEVYALLPQTLTLGLAGAYFRSRNQALLFWIGVLTAGAMLFKPTTFSISLAAAVVIVCRDVKQGSARRAIGHLATIALGGALALGIVAAYWWAKGALGDLWQATVVHNLIYAEGGFSLRGMYGAVRMLVVLQPMEAVVAAAVGGVAVFAWRFRRTALSSPKESEVSQETGEPLEAARAHDWRTWAIAGALLAIPLELMFLLISGRNYGHYFLTPLPALSTAAAYLFYEVRGLLKGAGTLGVGAIAALALLATVLGGWFVEVAVKELPRGEQLASATQPLRGSYALDGMSQYVVEHTDPEDIVLVWGNHPDVNFLTGRRAPSKYVFAMNLFFPGHEGTSRFDVFLEELRRSPPVLIFAQEVSSAGIPYFGASEQDLCPGCLPEAREGIRELSAYVESHYSLVDEIGDWVVFRRNG
ncbi:MAG: glycosyltransferase family 39 protein [Anaerolineales bacterium]|nr:glycosyltransferase family 39 protein [Anaerolineales bacterium]